MKREKKQEKLQDNFAEKEPQRDYEEVAIVGPTREAATEMVQLNVEQSTQKDEALLSLAS